MPLTPQETIQHFEGIVRRYAKSSAPEDLSLYIEEWVLSHYDEGCHQDITIAAEHICKPLRLHGHLDHYTRLYVWTALCEHYACKCCWTCVDCDGTGHDYWCDGPCKMCRGRGAFGSPEQEIAKEYDIQGRLTIEANTMVLQ